MFDGLELEQQAAMAQWLVQASNASEYEDLKTLDPMAQVRQFKRLGLQLSQGQALAELWECQNKAGNKFQYPQQTLLTRRSLEQASGRNLAEWKAARFKALPLDCPIVVLDLCCGAGADALAFAKYFPVVAVDRDPVLATFAQHNLKIAASENRFPAIACQSDVTVLLSVNLDEPFGAVAKYLGPAVAHWANENQLGNYRVCWHIDPDRRSENSRHIRLEDFSPGLDFIEALQMRFPRGMVKAAPATKLPSQWQETVDAFWLGEDRESKQLVLQFPGSGQHGCAVWNSRRSEWDELHRLNPTQPSETTIPSLRESDRPLVKSILRSAAKLEPGNWLVEFQPVVVQSSCLKQLIQNWTATKLSQDDYLIVEAGACDPNSALWSVFLVEQVLPARSKMLLKYLRETDSRLTEIKKSRVAAEFQQKMLKELRPAFKNRTGKPKSVLLVAGSDGKKVKAVIAERILAAPPAQRDLADATEGPEY